MRKPWQNGAKAYHQAESLQDAETFFGKRYRKRQYFILDEDSPDIQTKNCAICKMPLNGPPKGETKITPGATYGEYSPKYKKAVAYHYICGWTHTLNALFSMEM